jgi:lipoyl(octanoyl) transferase
VNTDLSFFDLMVPCGIAGVQMTSIASETGAPSVDWRAVEEGVVAAMAEAFALSPRVTGRAALAESAA